MLTFLIFYKFLRRSISAFNKSLSLTLLLPVPILAALGVLMKDDPWSFADNCSAASISVTDSDTFALANVKNSSWNSSLILNLLDSVLLLFLLIK